MSEYYTPRQVAKELNLSYQQVIIRLRKGIIKGQKYGWGWVIYKRDIHPQ